MWIYEIESLEKAIPVIRKQAQELISAQKHGIDIIVIPHKRSRSSEQNRFMHKIFMELSKFCTDTGWRLPGISFMPSPELCKCWCKGYFGIKNTSKLSTKEMMEFIDKIQLWLAEQTSGEWRIISPDELKYGGRE